MKISIEQFIKISRFCDAIQMRADFILTDPVTAKQRYDLSKLVVKAKAIYQLLKAQYDEERGR